jgi:hypothetical protein
VRLGAPINVLDMSRTYGSKGETGYTDYSALEPEPAE